MFFSFRLFPSKCTLSRTGEKLMTEPRQKTLSPIFEENLTFDFEVATPGEMLASNFVVEVWDADDALLDSDDFIGRAIIPLLHLPTDRKITRWM